MPSPLETRPLRGDDFEAVFTAFSEAFSDYVVRLAPDRDQLAEMLTRRGYLPAASVGVFDGERMVAFTLNGVDGDTAYDTGTGVVPSHRRQGLGRAMLDYLIPRLHERGCARYLLEVIESNHAAAELYRSHGFVDVRRLQCWRFEGEGLGAAAMGTGGRTGGGLEAHTTRAVTPPLQTNITEVRAHTTPLQTNTTEVQAHPTPEAPTPRIHDEWCDVAPSWQNSTASILRARERYVVFGEDEGYAVLFPWSGDLAQLAVRPEGRRRGIGTRLLREAARVAGKPLRIINVDASDEGIARFLEAAGAVKTVAQREMLLRL